MSYFTYILKSLKDGNYYVGITQDLDARLNYHNKGRVKSTKHRIPFKMVYHEEYPSMLKAREREKYLKSYRGSSEKLTILEGIE